MNELIEKVKAKTGLSDEQASQAVGTVIGFLKEKFPALASALDGMSEGGGGAAANVTGAIQGLGGLFGKS